MRLYGDKSRSKNVAVTFFFFFEPDFRRPKSPQSLPEAVPGTSRSGRPVSGAPASVGHKGRPRGAWPRPSNPASPAKPGCPIRVTFHVSLAPDAVTDTFNTNVGPRQRILQYLISKYPELQSGKVKIEVADGDGGFEFFDFPTFTPIMNNMELYVTRSPPDVISAPSPVDLSATDFGLDCPLLT
jgi:hypothetical protein